MKDYGHEETEKILKSIEARLHKEYKKATDEVQGKLRDYLDRFAKKDETWRKWVNDVKEEPKEYKKRLKEYQDWRVGQMAIGKRWQEMKETLAEDYHHTNDIAKQIVYGNMPEVYAINHNYGTFQVEKGSLIDTSYTLYDKSTVERLVRDNPKLLPDPGRKTAARIAAGKDIKWNEQQIQSVMMQGILQGKSIPALATSLAQTVGEKNRNAAIRNARTMTTGAQNAGRVDSYKRANDMGIKTRKQWLATLDGRTRHTHRQLDGEVVDNDDRFSNGCEFPGDPKGDASEIYNCRCSLIPAIKGHEIDASNLNLRRNNKLEGMSYNEWKKAKAESNPITLPEEKAKAIKGTYIADYKRKAGQIGGGGTSAPTTDFDSTKLKNVMGNNYEDFKKLVNASDNKKLYNKYVDECATIKQAKGQGYYKGATDTVSFDYELSHPGRNKYSTLAHELNHMFDKHIGDTDKLNFNEVDVINNTCVISSGAVKILKKLPSQSDEFLSALRKDLALLQPSVKNGSIKTELLASEITRNATHGVQDALDGAFSTSKQRILPWGHGEKYYNRTYNNWIKTFSKDNELKSAYTQLGIEVTSQAKAKREFRIYETASEAFANIGAAVTVGGEELKAITKYMPETLKAYLMIVGVI